ncbi:MAG: ankyrin repeat domain-containing protein, partial [Candidatus Gracilibacteria bacterium]|nr:ankyrin repeat domain-containing protein [Candidatus Gracilibacteria bacterium]
PDANNSSYAVYYEHKEQIDTFSQYEKDDKLGVLPILGAAAIGNLEKCKLLLKEGIDVNSVNDKGITPIFLAAINGHNEVFEFLLEKGADIHKINSKGENILSFMFHKPQIITAHTQGSILPGYIHDTFEDTNKITILKKILTLDVDINKVDNIDMTPLLHAMDSKQPISIVSILVENGANINSKNIKGKSAFNLRVYKGFGFYKFDNEESDLLKFFCNKGYDINSLDNNSNTVLRDAFWAYDSLLMKFLVENGININGETGKEVLSLAQDYLLDYRKKEGGWNGNYSCFLEDTIRLLGGSPCYWDQKKR